MATDLASAPTVVDAAGADTLAVDPATTATGRRYRSKKQRPCDLCRYRKIQCKIHSPDAACELCRKLDRACTFVLGPLTRTRGPSGVGDAGAGLAVAGRHRQQRRRERSSYPLPPDDDLLLESLLAASGRDGGAGGAGNGGGSGVEVPSLPMDVDSFWLPSLSPLDGRWGVMEFDLDPSLGDAQYHRASPQSHTSHESGGLSDALALSNTHGFRPRPDVSPVPASHRSPTTSNEIGSQSSPQQVVVVGSANHASPHLSSPGIASASMHHPSSTWPSDLSLDGHRGYSHELLGLSSESDPYFLRHYVYNANDTYPMYRLHFRQVVEYDGMPHRREGMPHGPMPVHINLEDEEIWKDHVDAVEGLFFDGMTEEGDAAMLDKLVSADFGARLLRLYVHHVYPRYPILSLADLSLLSRAPKPAAPTTATPIGIRSAVYALATPFTFLDDELSVSKGYLQVSADKLWAIAYRSFHRALRSTSRLPLLQLCLLLLQMPPESHVAADPPSLWSLSCTALGLAETLGLNIDPAAWKVPRTEVMLRRRLWWFTYAAHTWTALVCSRPSHLHEDNWDVGELTAGDFEGDGHPEARVRDAILRQVPICLAQCGLAVIAAGVLKEFYTLKANRMSLTLPALLARAQLLRTRVEGWRQTLPLLAKPASDLTPEEFEEGASLRISHLTLEILIFRALLRPLMYGTFSPAETAREPISTIFENCYTCARVVTEIVSSLKAQHFAGFWHPYVRYQLCYVSTFILMNLAQSTTREMAARHLTLLNKWRDTLRIQARAWPLAKLAAMRLDAIFWKGLLTVVAGAGDETPAVVLLREQVARAKQ